MAAVEVRGGYKYYGSPNDPNKKIILNYLDMNVPIGSIYGLLGASGCGKTTLLSCIVGQKKLQEGQISVLGTCLNTHSASTLGPRIGYMPQDIALVNELSIKETIYYFGRIYGMHDDRIRERFKILKDLLELPDSSRLVENLSGGQKRRVSFACALVHEPELVILDEPTVGLDPLLREKIWNFLVETTRTSKLAVIITTHYIDEARQANTIGMMRNGILLAEDTPTNIMQRFNCDNLEDAFLVLCQKHGTSEEADTTMGRAAGQKFLQSVSNQQGSHQNQSESKPDAKTKEANASSTVKHDSETQTDLPKKGKLKRNLSFHEQRPDTLIGKLTFTSQIRMKALLTKNLLQLIRQPSGVLFIFLFPILQCTCFYLAIGDNPKSLKLGIVNEEVPNWQDCYNNSLVTAQVYDYECNLTKVSCRYLRDIPPEYAIQVHFNSKEEAYAEAKKANIIGFVHFASNFTESIKDILDNNRDARNGSFESREIQVRLDMSNQQVAFFLERKLRETYGEFAQKLMIDCELPRALATIPINFKKPVYSSFDADFQEYAAPGVIMTMVFFLATLVTAAVFITDRMEGVWERTLVAGISTTELLLAHIVTQSVIVFLQCTEVIFFIGVVFGTENNGDNLTVILLLSLTGFAGMLFGMLISIFCESHTMANFVSTGAFYPMIVLCGLLWPLEGMPQLLRDFALLLPFTIPTISVRNILSKGMPITNPNVYSGFIVIFLWIAGFFFLCLAGLRRKK
ncbi:ABC transporter G family member 23 [Sitodiplosis mosellana]|uniref:ABC transporter G family member 23 n=1 Tax=Sitodiplosis mosellana TaxID=263140 RepID=UPI00244411B7|nr:ABC transporter G family member 23 [Sitodiplosis mosellana]XP_055325393.1 ABC transporter G family member 23 [Sitodiplosis mosellana]XP_055325394.1 ABC transporter G family member 23 [Sitodiplosis mosellana]